MCASFRDVRLPNPPFLFREKVVRLSQGDIDGYLRTVNKDNYRLNFFVVSLVRRIPAEPDEADWVDHFLFVRGEDSFFDITSHVSIVDSPTTCGEYAGHGVHHDPSRSQAAGTEHRGNETADFAPWYQTAEGRSVLAEDRCFFARKFGDQVQATRVANRIKLTGRDRHVVFSVNYPVSSGQEAVSIVLKDDDKTVLEISCDVSHRKLGFIAAIAAAREL